MTDQRLTSVVKRQDGAVATSADGQQWFLKSGAYLVGADLRAADLTGIDLTGVDLSFANLAGVTAEGVDLKGANLSSTNLNGSNFRKADLTGVTFEGATAACADFEDAVLNDQSIINRQNLYFPPAFDAKGERVYLDENGERRPKLVEGT